MHHINSFPLEVLVELIAAHDAQSLVGSPVDRVEARLSISLDLARKAGLQDLKILLDREDLQWLCDALGIEWFSSAATRLRIGDVPIHRAGSGYESHIVGAFSDRTSATFPLVREPTHTPGFVKHHASDQEKSDLLAKFVAIGYADAIKGFRPPPSAKLH